LSQVNHKSLHKCPYKREERDKHRKNTNIQRKRCEDRGRDWNDVAISQGTLAAISNWKRQRMHFPQSWKGLEPYHHLLSDFWPSEL
jgi:hypothetical protein